MEGFQLKDWLQEILVRIDKVSKLIDNNKSLMTEEVIGLNGHEPLYVWTKEIMVYKYESEIKTSYTID